MEGFDSKSVPVLLATFGENIHCGDREFERTKFAEEEKPVEFSNILGEDRC